MCAVLTARPLSTKNTRCTCLASHSSLVWNMCCPDGKAIVYKEHKVHVPRFPQQPCLECVLSSRQGHCLQRTQGARASLLTAALSGICAVLTARPLSTKNTRCTCLASHSSLTGMCAVLTARPLSTKNTRCTCLASHSSLTGMCALLTARPLSTKNTRCTCLASHSSLVWNMCCPDGKAIVYKEHKVHVPRFPQQLNWNVCCPDGKAIVYKEHKVHAPRFPQQPCLEYVLPWRQGHCLQRTQGARASLLTAALSGIYAVLTARPLSTNNTRCTCLASHSSLTGMCALLKAKIVQWR